MVDKIKANGNSMFLIDAQSFNKKFVFLHYPNTTKNIISSKDGKKQTFFICDKNKLANKNENTYLSFFFKEYDDNLRESLILNEFPKHDISHCFPSINYGTPTNLGETGVYHATFHLDENGKATDLPSMTGGLLIITDLWCTPYYTFDKLEQYDDMGNNSHNYDAAIALLIHAFYVSYKYTGFVMGGFPKDDPSKIIIVRKSLTKDQCNIAYRTVAESGSSNYVLMHQDEYQNDNNIYVPIILDLDRSDMNFSDLQINGANYKGFSLYHDFDGNIIKDTDLLNIHGQIKHGTKIFDIGKIYKNEEFKSLKRNSDMYFLGKFVDCDEVEKVLKSLFYKKLVATGKVTVINSKGEDLKWDINHIVTNVTNQLDKNEELMTLPVLIQIPAFMDYTDVNTPSHDFMSFTDSSEYVQFTKIHSTDHVVYGEKTRDQIIEFSKDIRKIGQLNF